jgi:hypothetical protein
LTLHTTEDVVYNSEVDARAQTPLAAIFVPDGEGQPKGRIFIYFLNNKAELWRAWSYAGPSVKLDFEHAGNRSEHVSDSGALTTWSQISVVHDTEKAQNIIYAVKEERGSETETGQVSAIYDDYPKTTTA